MVIKAKQRFYILNLKKICKKIPFNATPVHLEYGAYTWAESCSEEWHAGSLISVRLQHRQGRTTPQIVTNTAVNSTGQTSHPLWETWRSKLFFLSGILNIIGHQNTQLCKFCFYFSFVLFFLTSIPYNLKFEYEAFLNSWYKVRICSALITRLLFCTFVHSY